jgi:hypothetical protein
LKELELARERGEFVALADVEKLMTDLVVVTKAQILGAPVASLRSLSANHEPLLKPNSTAH